MRTQLAPPRLVSTALLASVILSSAPEAATITVAPDESGDYPTIQAAIDAAVTEDELVLLDGTFTGPGNRDLTLGGKNLTVRSESGDPALATIDAESEARLLLVRGGEALQLMNVGILNGRVQGQDGPAFGGGILVEDTASLDISGCVVRNCEALGNSAARVAGGGIAVVDQASVEGTDVEFSDNRAGYGFGGPPTVFSGGGVAVLDAATAHFTDTRFVENRALTGGGLYSENGITLRDCSFDANVAQFDDEGVGSPRRGGGAAISGSVDIRDTRFENNRAIGGGSGEAARGGGLWVRGSGFVQRAVISGNVALHGKASSGGGADIEGITLRGSVITNNTLGDDPIPFAEGGGVRAVDSTISQCAVTGNHGQLGAGVYVVNTSIFGSTIAGNGNADAGSRLGGGVYTLGEVDITTSIVSGNCVEADGLGQEIFADGPTTLFCSAVGPAEGATVGSVTFDGEIVTTDPEFCGPESCTSAPTASGDYTISSTSPCHLAVSSCGKTMGYFWIGCDSTPIETMSWGRLKSRF